MNVLSKLLNKNRVSPETQLAANLHEILTYMGYGYTYSDTEHCAPLDQVLPYEVYEDDHDNVAIVYYDAAGAPIHIHTEQR